MIALEIFKSQFLHLIKNFREFFKIIFPLALFAVLLELSFNTLIQNDKFVFWIILRIIYVFFLIRTVINIHRLIILNEAFNYYALNKRFKETLLYICYAILGFVVTSIVFIPFGALIMTLHTETNSFYPYPIQFKIFFGIFFTISYVFLVLNFPMISTGEKIRFFKMIKLSKGFRLTLLLQAIIFFIIGYAVNYITGFIFGFISFFSIPLVTITLNMILTFFSFLIMAWSISCLSKTYMLWSKKKH